MKQTLISTLFLLLLYSGGGSYICPSSGFKADGRVFFGIHGDVTVSDKDRRSLHNYQFQAGSDYVSMWHQDLPQDIGSDCWKALSATGTIFLKNGKYSPTVALGTSGSQILERIIIIIIIIIIDLLKRTIH